jgi:hypothetical protein
MKKSALQKPIKEILLGKGFERIKPNDYAISAGDGSTKLILRIPDGKKGFILAAQFADFGVFDGVFANAVMRQYDFAYVMAYGDIKEYSESEIRDATERVLDAYECYLSDGARAIKECLDGWTFGDLDERVRDAVQRHFGLAGIDPYSKEYQVEKSDELKRHGGAIILTLCEYNEHKDFYDSYTLLGGRITVDEKKETVMISFAQERKHVQE